MANPEYTTVDTGDVFLRTGANLETDHRAFTPTATKTYPKGTILAVLAATPTKWTPFVKGGALGAEIPKSILTHDVVGVDTVDQTVEGVVGVTKAVLERCIIDADGDASNIDKVVVDQLRDFQITLLPVAEVHETRPVS